MQQERIKFQCYNCPETYSVTRILEPDEKPSLVVRCPFCDARSVVDLSLYPRKTPPVMRGGSDSTAAQGDVILPDIVPTKPYDEEAG